MSDVAAVLFANETFYAAFAGGDIAAMEALWAEEGPVVCIHPGWQALSDRGRIMASWRAILESPNRPAIRCHGAEAFPLGEVALVVCYESVGAGVLVATNGFRRQDGHWRMVHHQAGPTTEHPPEPPAEPVH